MGIKGRFPPLVQLFAPRSVNHLLLAANSQLPKSQHHTQLWLLLATLIAFSRSRTLDCYAQVALRQLTLAEHHRRTVSSNPVNQQHQA